ncbi:hypothetical protein HII28_12190 [Planctomonas sp. JC2975]|uniref:YdeI/OmpD-associated family protein n=1 Tax=Planctomonas sp. JC2975 TaxID=2729626 RepID=UPI001473455E|nr:YdeI/OmpD-associated family protein [Planctomonas sp. JC2975]NNC12633.1 hypothetical protein [Planctomonas sp. JC2975]
MPSDDAEQVHCEDPAAWRAWLLRNHDSSSGVWLVSWRRPTGRPAMTYDESVTEAVAVGWVDSQAKTIDEERSALWFGPRRPGSPWAGTNKVRVTRLESDGRMTDAGRRVIEIAKADGSWTLLDDAEALVVPDDLAVALADAGATDAWFAQTQSVQKASLTKLALAKRAQTRAKYVGQIAEGLEAR